METVLLCRVAVSSATYAIDRGYDYLLPDSLRERAVPGMRVVVPFGNGNRRVEGLILSLASEERRKGLKSVVALLDEQPVLSRENIRLAVWMHERYCCTVYEAVKTMLPTGLYYSLKDRYVVNPDLDRGAVYVTHTRPMVRRVLDLLYDQGGSMEKAALYTACGTSDPHSALRELTEHGVLTVETSAQRGVGDKQEQRVALAMPAEQALAQIGKRSLSQAAVIRLLGEFSELSVKDIKYFTGAGSSVVKALEKRGIVTLETRTVFRTPQYRRSEPAEKPELNEEQSRCLEGLEQLLVQKQPSCALVYGVTGSGKTSVYIRLIHTALSRGKTALVLVPEIALTPQLLFQFTSQFGSQVAVLHSMLSPGERYDEWKRVRDGLARVVVGTRSAVFAPLEQLGLVIMDEEQESGYKSETAPRYHAREVAKFRAVQSGGLLVLGSATPCVESMYHAKAGDYHLFTLRNRYNRRSLPQVYLTDMKEELKNGNAGAIGSVLRREIEENLKRGEQSILFINRRGSSKMVLCSECGESPGCVRCTVRLTYHKANGRLMCHYCGHSQPLPGHCPACGGDLVFYGAGTQKVQEEIETLFPGIEVLRMDTDTVSATQTHEKLLEKFRTQKIPVLVGTQMVAKGLDFENVTLVGVVSADQSLYVEDYRASERTFSLLTQVVGRAGRGGRTGRAVIQTFTPANDVIRRAAEQNYDAFYESEIALRGARGIPPYREMYVFTVSGEDEGAVLRCCMRLRDGLRMWQSNAAMADSMLQILGPAAAAVLMVNNRYRYRITVLGRSGAPLRKMIAHILKTAGTDRMNRDVSVSVDVNPMD